MRRIAFVLVALLLPVVMMAQVVVKRSTERTTIGGKEYYMHHVMRGETLYSISKAYNVSVEEITSLNPEVEGGLQADMVIGIPVRDEGDSDDAQNVADITASSETPRQEFVESGNYVVQRGETLYTIAKKFGADLAGFKVLNPGLGNYPSSGMVIKIPAVRNEEEYLVHQVESGERTSSLLNRWEVDEDEFRVLNPSVGNRVFEGQIVLIPIEKISYSGLIVSNDDQEREAEESPVENNASSASAANLDDFASDCADLPENAKELYKVALLIPLYLNEVNGISVSRENVVKARKSRPFTFLQFYEGFMLAVDSLVEHYGLRLDLTVIDVNENVGSAESAVKELEKKHVDLIIGPFFSKSFVLVQEYAMKNGILIVNPLSSRENIVVDNPYVVKVKPKGSAQLPLLAALVNKYYGDSNVLIVSEKSIAEKSSQYLDEMEQILNLAINAEVEIQPEEFIRYAERESRRQEMGSKLPSTIEVEGQVYATKDIASGVLDNVKVENRVKRYVYDADDMKHLTESLSGVRNNLVIAYGNDNVFATQMLNKLNKSAERNPITLVALPDWANLEKLLVENLLKVNAIYFSDNFVDYNSDETGRFILQFRKKYACEPQEYAFCGYDVAWYFMNALMKYGHSPKDCLPYFEMDLLSAPFRFVKGESGRGLENYSWSIYQYDKDSLELKPIDVSRSKE